MKLDTIKNMVLAALLSIALPCYAGDSSRGSTPYNFDDASSSGRSTPVAHVLSTDDSLNVPAAVNVEPISLDVATTLTTLPDETLDTLQSTSDFLTDASTTPIRVYNLVKGKDCPNHALLLAHANTSVVTHALTIATPVPAAFDVRSLDPKFPAPFNQYSLGSCTANALCALVQYILNIEGVPTEELSRLFVYFNERMKEHNISVDSGASLATGILTLHQYGVCSEKTWTYSDNPIKFRMKPSPAAYAEALNNVDLDNLAVDSIDQSLAALKHTIAVAQRPFVLGIQLFESFESAAVTANGMVPMPQRDATGIITEKCLGGHAVLCVGYDDAKQCFTIRNSWGSDWGDGGYFYLPYDYVTNEDLALDFWSISRIGKMGTAA